MRLKQKASVALAAVTVTSDDHGYIFYDRQEILQVWASGLDGGTWTIQLYMPPPNERDPTGGNLMDYETGLTSADFVLVDGPVFCAFKVTFGGLGGAAAPIVKWTTRARK